MVRANYIYTCIVYTHQLIHAYTRYDFYVKLFIWNRQMHAVKLSAWLTPAPDTPFGRLLFVRNNFPKNADCQHATHQQVLAWCLYQPLIRNNLELIHFTKCLFTPGQVDSWSIESPSIKVNLLNQWSDAALKTKVSNEKNPSCWGYIYRGLHYPVK